MRPVLLHAYPLDERMWEPQLEVLRAYEPHAPRLYGRGSSVDEWALQILDEVDGDVVPVGASMGGYVALSMARQAPERVRAIVLAGSRAAADTPERRRARDETIARLRAEGVPAEAAWGVRPEELIEATEALRDRRDATEVVRAFAGPLLVVAGADDDTVPVEEAREVAGLAPRGRLEVLEGAGHLLSIDRADRFDALLLDFLDACRG
jgi:pimeloyl-ACP methyl ester carboxylesterase